jgi:hypothetical protein
MDYIDQDGGGAQALVANSEGLGAPLFWGRLDRDNSGLCGPVPSYASGRVEPGVGLRSEQRREEAEAEAKQDGTAERQGNRAEIVISTLLSVRACIRNSLYTLLLFLLHRHDWPDRKASRLSCPLRC